MQTRSQKARSECPICLDPISTGAGLDHCSHVFCADCITRWAKNENSCPLCKRRFGYISTVHSGPNYTGKRRRVVRQRVERRDQSQSDPFVQLYVDSLERHQFLSIDQDMNFFSFLLQLQAGLNRL